jgi:hypothetical protein
MKSSAEVEICLTASVFKFNITVVLQTHRQTDRQTGILVEKQMNGVKRRNIETAE